MGVADIYGQQHNAPQEKEKVLVGKLAATVRVPHSKRFANGAEGPSEQDCSMLSLEKLTPFGEDRQRFFPDNLFEFSAGHGQGTCVWRDCRIMVKIRYHR